MSEIFTPRNDLGRLTETSPMFPRRDPNSLNKQWQNLNRSLARNGSLTNKLSQTVVALGRIKKAGFSINTENYFPFKIYQPQAGWYPANTNTVGTTFDGSGNGSKVYINPSVPTNLSASPPTINPKTDLWRLWLVRDGIVEVRPYNWLDVDSPFGFPAINNFSLMQDCQWGTDQFSDPYDEPPDATAVTSGFFGPAGSSYPDTNYWVGTLVITNNDFTGVDPAIQTLFWLEITPDQSDMQNVFTRIKHISNASIPAYSPFLVPIGVVTVYEDQTSEPIIGQYTFNHLINRWPTSVSATNGTGIVGPPTQAQLYSKQMTGAVQYRGNWQSDASIQTLAFYPGDYLTYTTTGNLVTVQQGSSGPLSFGSASQQDTYLCIQNCFTSDPSSDPNFIHIGQGIYDVVA